MESIPGKVAAAEPSVNRGNHYIPDGWIIAESQWPATVYRPFPSDEQTRRHAFVAAALFAAGITSLVLTNGSKHETNTRTDLNPSAGSIPSPEKSAQKYSPAPPAIRPIGTDGSSIDGLVPFLPLQPSQSPAPIPTQLPQPSAQIHDPSQTPLQPPGNAPADEASLTAHGIIASVLGQAAENPFLPFASQLMIEVTKPKPQLRPMSFSSFTRQTEVDGFQLITRSPFALLPQKRLTPNAVQTAAPRDTFSRTAVKLLPQDQEDFWKAVRLNIGQNNPIMYAAEQSLEEDYHRGAGYFTLITYGKNQELQFFNPLGRGGATHVEISKRQDGSYGITAEPLVFDLKNTGVRVSDRWVRYDITGKGRIERFHDIASTNGILVFDSDRSGVSGKNARELFGDKTDLEGIGRPDGYKDGFEALEALVRKAQREGVLPPDAPVRGRLGPEDLTALGKAYGLGIRVGSLRNETISLKEAGIREIALSPEPSLLTENFDGQGDNVARRKGAVFIRDDGSTGSYEAVFFAYDPASLQQIAFR